VVIFELREEAVKSIQVDGDVYAYLVAHGMGAGHSASDVLRQALFHAIDIDDDLYAYLISLASGPDGTANLTCVNAGKRKIVAPMPLPVSSISMAATPR
jgi:hypothetical protein